jgi:TetR/AcrR family transcriptional regulator, transcriptional repressor for nem operon
MSVAFPHTAWYVKQRMKTAAQAPAREAAKQETRDALIAAGAAEFAEKGIDGPSLDAICARAGFTRGAFYVHFRDRDDLLVAVLDRILSRHQERLVPTGEDEVDLRRTILRFVALVASGEGVTVGTPQWRFRHTLAACARVPAMRERYVALQRRGIARVATAVAAGQRDGTVRGDVDPEVLAEILVTMTLGVSAATELDLPLDLLAGGAAIERLVAAGPPAPTPRRRPPGDRARSVRRRRRRSG